MLSITATMQSIASGPDPSVLVNAVLVAKQHLTLHMSCKTEHCDKLQLLCRAVLQILILLFALGTLATGQFHRFRIALVGLLAVTTVLFCDAAQTFYYCEYHFLEMLLTHAN